MREVVVSGTDRTLVDGEELAVPWRELPVRLAEAAVARLVPALAQPEALEALWRWEHPLQVAAEPVDPSDGDVP